MKSRFKNCFKNPTLASRFQAFCELLLGHNKPGKKFLITDAGGSGDLTRPTHYFFFEEVEIKKPITCLYWRGHRNPTPKSVLIKLEEIQSRIPEKDFSKLTLILLSEQQKRDRKEIPINIKEKTSDRLAA